MHLLSNGVHSRLFLLYLQADDDNESRPERTVFEMPNRASAMMETE